MVYSDRLSEPFGLAALGGDSVVKKEHADLNCRILSTCQMGHWWAHWMCGSPFILLRSGRSSNGGVVSLSNASC